MRSFSSVTVLGIADAMASTLGQAMQLARTRLAFAASPSMQLMTQRDHEVTESELLRRELEILQAGRKNMLLRKRSDYCTAQRMAILPLMRLRGWNVKTAARHFVIHENTLRAWIRAVEGSGRASLLAGAIVWNRIDDAVRWAAHELRRLCPEPEFGTRTMARHLLRAGIQISRSSVQRILREPEHKKPPRKPRPVIEEPVGVEPHDLLTPKEPNRVWHCDMTQIRVLWRVYYVAAILDGFSRKLLTLKVYAKTPNSRNMAALLRRTSLKNGKPKFIITDNGAQFRRKFGKATKEVGIKHVRSRVRAPYLDGKIERFFRTFKLWWRLDIFIHWYNTFRPQSALGFSTPEEAFAGRTPGEPFQIRARDGPNLQIDIARRQFRGEPRLPIIEITARRAAKKNRSTGR